MLEAVVGRDGVRNKVRARIEVEACLFILSLPTMGGRQLAVIDERN